MSIILEEPTGSERFKNPVAELSEPDSGTLINLSF